MGYNSAADLVGLSSFI